MQAHASDLEKQLLALKKRPVDLDPVAEAIHLAALLTDVLGASLSGYSQPKIEGVGGSGVVMSAVFEELGVKRAIKVPRERAVTEAKAGGPVADVSPELRALSLLSHKNITRLYASYPLPDGLHCVITECVDNPVSLDDYAAATCCGADARESSAVRASALRRFAELLYDVTDALHYMHTTARIIHFDVKPDNILVASTGQPFITDLGFARELAKYPPGTPVPVGFTWRYAHPTLTDPEQGARISSNPARARRLVDPKDIAPIIDLFAFGRSLQECLKRMEDVYGDMIHSDYTFSYLHVVACLCLDGRNAANARVPRTHFVSDQALEMPVGLFHNQKLQTFGSVQIALQRLLGRRRLEDDIPELDRWASGTINVSDLGITTLTSRTKRLVEHPAMQRLATENQLGLLDTVFPAANHTRLQHSLGVFHAVGEYITTLYYDPENPTFRALFNEEQCKTALVAALVHDVGQATFGHELEEVDKEEFSHEAIGHDILKHCTLVSGDLGRDTIRALIERVGPGEWNVKVDRVVALLSGESTSPCDVLLHDILDGQLDADKLDYLVRDTVETRVQYGHGIDHDRFLRSLTTLAVEESDGPALRLAVKRKGAASAEAFALARYQLYQALYWHHTFRAIKAMFITAASKVLADVRVSAPGHDMFDAHPFRTAYLEHVLHVGRLNPSSPDSIVKDLAEAKEKKSSRGKAFQTTVRDTIERGLQSDAVAADYGPYATDNTIQFFFRLASGRTRMLLQDIARRRYYKRILEVPLSDFTEEGWVTLRELMSGPKRLELQRSIATSLVLLLRSAIQDKSTIRESLVVDKSLESADAQMKDRFAFLIDLPTRGWTSHGSDPLFVSDYKRRHFRAGAGAPTNPAGQTLWTEHIGPMMRQIAFFRVYCEPDLHDILRRVLGPADVFRDVIKHLPSMRVKGMA
jgi:HD superfamily phosphohydrolase